MEPTALDGVQVKTTLYYGAYELKHDSARAPTAVYHSDNCDLGRYITTRINELIVSGRHRKRAQIAEHSGISSMRQKPVVACR